MRICWTGDNTDEILLNCAFCSIDPVMLEIKDNGTLVVKHRADTLSVKVGEYIQWFESDGGWFGNIGARNMVEEKKSIIDGRLIVDNYMLTKPLLDRLAYNKLPWWKKLLKRFGWGND